jgi:ParB-like chromosome segregation protein Spo0J
MADDTTTLAALTADPENAREHNPRNVGMIEDALGEVGAARSIVVDENGRILAGNATVEAASNAGIERVRIVDADGEELIAVRRSGLTEAQKKRLAYFDNRTAELADWDVEQVAADLADGFEFDGLLSGGELDDILGDLAPDALYERPGDDLSGYQEQYGVIVICDDERQQEEVYDTLTHQGHRCKVVTT